MAHDEGYVVLVSLGLEHGAVEANELLDGIELSGQQAGLAVRSDEEVGSREAAGPLAGRHGAVLEEVEVVVDPDERSRVALDRAADGEKLQLGKPLLGSLMSWTNLKESR